MSVLESTSGRAGSRSQLRDEAARYLREVIISGEAKPGSLLRLEPIAEDLEMSATPVREALLLLAQDDWVVQEPNRGFRVARIGRQDVEDAYFVNSFCAGELAARAAAVIGEEDIAKLEALIERMRELEEVDPDRIEDLNRKFHASLYAHASSPRLVWFVSATTRYVPRRHWLSVPGWLEMTRIEHRPIVDALRNRDGDEVRGLIAKHVRHAGQLHLSHLDALGFFDAEDAG